jgi:hypothetical protein
VIDPERVAIELGQAADIDGHHHHASGILGLFPADPAHQAQGHELARVFDAGRGVDADAAHHHRAGLQLEPGRQKLPIRDLRRRGGRSPLLRAGIARQPEALLTVVADEEDLNDVALIGEDLIDPGGVARPSDIDLIRIALLAEDQAGLGELRQQADHLVSTGEVLVEIAKVGAQILQIGALVEQRVRSSTRGG